LIKTNDKQNIGVLRLRIFENIKLEYDVNEIIYFCHLERIKGKLDNIVDIISESYKLLDPKAMYEPIKINEINGVRLILNNETFFESNLLVDKLKCAKELAIYIVTIGPALEQKVAELGSVDLARSFILDCVGTYALRQIFNLIRKDYQPNDLKQVSKFSPGSTSNWDMSQQRVLFDILGPKKVEEAIGVKLNEYCVMIPRKSVSGVMVETEEQFQECQICEKRCEFRKAPFKG
jgi:hypothetical protein